MTIPWNPDGITAERLREVLHYDAESGVFTWIASTARRGRKRIGHRAGTIDDRGYVIIKINQKLYQASRLAWLYVTGEWPKNQIDHQDQITGNNAFLNLRDVTGRVNQQNQRRAHSQNVSGFLGVIRRRNKWVARLQLDGKHRWIGTFTSAEDAYEAYVKAKRLLHEGCTL